MPADTRTLPEGWIAIPPEATVGMLMDIAVAAKVWPASDRDGVPHAIQMGINAYYSAIVKSAPKPADYNPIRGRHAR
jgi:hypothetical protein